MNCSSCDRPVHARGLCDTHYRRVLRAEKPAKDPGPALEQRRAAAVKARAATIARTAERLDDLTELLNAGEWPPRAVTRLGWTIRGALHTAEQHGRKSITQALNPHQKEKS